MSAAFVITAFLNLRRSSRLMPQILGCRTSQNNRWLSKSPKILSGSFFLPGMWNENAFFYFLGSHTFSHVFQYCWRTVSRWTPPMEQMEDSCLALGDTESSWVVNNETVMLTQFPKVSDVSIHLNKLLLEAGAHLECIFFHHFASSCLHSGYNPAQAN